MDILFTQIEGYADGQKFRIIRSTDGSVQLTASLPIDTATKKALIARATVALLKLSLMRSESKTALT